MRLTTVFVFCRRCVALDGWQFNANPEEAARAPCLPDESPSKPHPEAAGFFPS